MLSKGAVQVARDAAARKQRALVSMRLALREALAAGIAPENAANRTQGAIGDYDRQ
jgi:hypothetical protein